MNLKLILILLSFLGFLAINSCGGWNIAQAKSSVHFKPETIKDENDVILYFYCFDSILGDKLPLNILVDGKKVGEVIIGGYSYVHTTAGNHEIVFERPALFRMNEKINIFPTANQVVVFRIGKNIETVEPQQAFYEINEMREQRYSSFYK